MTPTSLVLRTSLAVSICSLGLGAAMCASPSGSPPAPSPSPGGASPLAPSAITSTSSSVPRLTPGDLVPLAHPQFDVGRMDASTQLKGMSLLFQRTPSQQIAADSLLRDLQNPLSPRYHQWITPAQYAASFGASADTVARATKWLAAQGFTVHGAASTGARLFFSGNVGQLETAFNTEMHRYDVHGEHHFALAKQPTYPAEFSSSVLGLRGTHDFRMKPMIASSKKPLPNYILGYPDDAEPGGAGEWLHLAPADFVKIYDLQPLYNAGINGKGQTIAIVGESEFNPQDIVAFRTQFDLDLANAWNTPTTDFVPYSGNPVYNVDAFGEAELDLEWSGAVAPEAAIKYLYTGDNPLYGVWDAIAYAIERGIYPLISASYGGCEGYFTPSDTIFLLTMGDAAAMQGTTVVNSSGDWGAASCDADTPYTAAQYGQVVSWPASIPSFVAVGGTEFDWGSTLLPTWVLPESDGGYTAYSPNYPDAGTEPNFSEYWACTGLSPFDAVRGSRLRPGDRVERARVPGRAPRLFPGEPAAAARASSTRCPPGSYRSPRADRARCAWCPTYRSLPPGSRSASWCRSPGRPPTATAQRLSRRA